MQRPQERDRQNQDIYVGEDTESSGKVRKDDGVNTTCRDHYIPRVLDWNTVENCGKEYRSRQKDNENNCPVNEVLLFRLR